MNKFVWISQGLTAGSMNLAGLYDVLKSQPLKT